MFRRLATLTVFLALLAGVLACTSDPEAVGGVPPISGDADMPISGDADVPISGDADVRNAVVDAPQTVDDIPRITAEELKAELDKGTVTVIDVRGAKSYAAAQMPGAVNIPEAEVRSRAGELSRDGLIVTYCT